MVTCATDYYGLLYGVKHEQEQQATCMVAGCGGPSERARRTEDI